MSRLISLGTLASLRHVPEIESAGRQRARLTTRLEQLKKQHGWGDLTDDEYMKERDAAQAALAQLPEGDRIVAFDAHRARILTLPDAVAVASPVRREELCRLLVERVTVTERRVIDVDWVPQARPFMKRQRPTGAPKGGGSGSRTLSRGTRHSDRL